MSKVTGARDVDTGEVTWHAEASMTADYDTLCSLSLADDLTERVEAKRGQKVTCDACKLTFLQAKRFRSADFDC